MARAARLKVYRTPIGFHDAYVAAPSQKAALVAWGSAHNLFATGEAELVTDPSMTKVPLATPGKIVRRVRGTTAEHIAALPAEPEAQPEPRSKLPKAVAASELRPKIKRAVRLTSMPPPPKPGRSAVDAAEAALAAALERQCQERQVLGEREQELRREQQALDISHKAAAASLRTTIRAAEAADAKAFAQLRRASNGAPED